jgi:protein-disulfide isomerase
MTQISRRQLLLAGTALAVMGVVTPALAVDVAELHKPPALGEMALGAGEDAKVTIVEYASATCPHCATFHKDAYKKLKAEYIDTNKIRFVFREFPLNDAALAAFMIARAAPKESYFPLIDVFFETLDTWAQNPAEGLLNIAKQAGFSQEKFNETLKNQDLAKGIIDIRDAGTKFGVTGTPAFFINGESYDGDRTYEAFKAKIDPLLL